MARGELDVVAQKGHHVRFVEVKARQVDDPLADAALSYAQQQRIIQAAEAWMADHPHVQSASFVVAWVFPEGPIRWLHDAFDA